jgi:hypothetical protein
VVGRQGMVINRRPGDGEHIAANESNKPKFNKKGLKGLLNWGGGCKFLFTQVPFQIIMFKLARLPVENWLQMKPKTYFYESLI